MRPSVNIPLGLWQLNQQLGLRHSNMTFEIEGALACMNPVMCYSCLLQCKGAKLNLEVAATTHGFLQLCFHSLFCRRMWDLEGALLSWSFSAFLRVEFYQTFLQMSPCSHMMPQRCLKHPPTASQDMFQPWSYSQLHADKEQMLPNRFVPKRICQILQIPISCNACSTAIQELQMLVWLVRGVHVLHSCQHSIRVCTGWREGWIQAEPAGQRGDTKQKKIAVSSHQDLCPYLKAT